MRKPKPMPAYKARRLQKVRGAGSWWPCTTEELFARYVAAAADFPLPSAAAAVWPASEEVVRSVTVAVIAQ